MSHAFQKGQGGAGEDRWNWPKSNLDNGIFLLGNAIYKSRTDVICADSIDSNSCIKRKEARALHMLHNVDNADCVNVIICAVLFAAQQSPDQDAEDENSLEDMKDEDKSGRCVF